MSLTLLAHSDFSVRTPKYRYKDQQRESSKNDDLKASDGISQILYFLLGVEFNFDFHRESSKISL